MKLIKPSLWDDLTSSNLEILSSRNYSYLPLDTIHETRLFFGKEIRSNDKCIMFQSKKELYIGKEFPSAEGFEVRIDFLQNPEGKDGIVLKLANPDFTNVFISLINDLLSSLKETSDEETFVDTFISRLAIWKMFMKNDPLKGMGLQQQKGLFGELTFLDDHLIKSKGSGALKFWTGPLMATHDFEIGNIAVEVKTTSGSLPEVVHISNEKQLNDEGYQSLFLYKVSISCRKNTSPTLPELIDKISNTLSNGEEIIKFKDLLLRYGYHELHRDLYINNGFHLDSVDIYKVTTGFPRIIRSDLKPGIGSIKYSVDISSIQNFKFDPKEFISFLKDN